MIEDAGSIGASDGIRREADAELKKVAQQLEGVFIEQLMKAMRSTVPEGDLGRGGAGEDIFTGLMDQQVSDAAAARGHGGLSAAIYRQMRARIQTNPSEGKGSR